MLLLLILLLMLSGSILIAIVSVQANAISVLNASTVTVDHQNLTTYGDAPLLISQNGSLLVSHSAIVNSTINGTSKYTVTAIDKPFAGRLDITSAHFLYWNDTGSSQRNRELALGRSDNVQSLSAVYNISYSGCDGCIHISPVPPSIRINASDTEGNPIDGLSVTEIQNSAAGRQTKETPNAIFNMTMDLQPNIFSVPANFSDNGFTYYFSHWQNVWNNNQNKTQLVFRTNTQGLDLTLTAVYSLSDKPLLQRLDKALSAMENIHTEEIPFALAAVDDARMVLEVAIYEDLATQPLEVYEQRLRELLGEDLPIEVTYGYFTPASESS